MTLKLQSSDFHRKKELGIESSSLNALAHIWVESQWNHKKYLKVINLPIQSDNIISYLPQNLIWRIFIIFHIFPITILDLQFSKIHITLFLCRRKTEHLVCSIIRNLWCKFLYDIVADFKGYETFWFNPILAWGGEFWPPPLRFFAFYAKKSPQSTPPEIFWLFLNQNTGPFHVRKKIQKSFGTSPGEPFFKAGVKWNSP